MRQYGSHAQDHDSPVRGLAIVENHPHSVYELAKALDKDQGNVQRDVKALEQLGLVKLKSVKDGDRERLMPVPQYEKIVLEFEPKKVANG